jgi:hypothetical protein
VWFVTAAVLDQAQRMTSILILNSSVRLTSTFVRTLCVDVQPDFRRW